MNGNAAPSTVAVGAQPTELFEQDVFARSILANAPLGIVVVALDGRIVRVNPQMSTITGYPPEGLLGRHVIELTHPEDRTDTTELLDGLLVGDLAAYELEKRYLRCDGTTAFVHVWSGLLRDEAGRPAFQIGMVQDLTPVREAQEREAEARAAQAASERRAAAFADHGSELVAVFAMDGRLRYANAATTEFLATSPVDVRTSLRELIHPGDRDVVVRVLGKLLREEGGTRQLTCRLRRHDGRYREFRLSLSDLRHLPQVEGILVNAADVTELVQTRTRLEHQATHDGLTGLANRTLLLDTLRSSSDAGALLCVIDLDGFGALNDRVGHLAGDVLLRSVGARLLAHAPDGSLVARTNGDEFALLVRGHLDADEALAATRELLDVLAAPLAVPGGGTVRLACHAGVAIAAPGRSTTSLLRDADLALGEARSGPPGMVVACDDALRDRRARHHALATALASDELEDQLEIHYQPIVDLDSGRPVAVEALLRWHHPTLGDVSPGELIPLAERTGAIVRIGRWVLRAACAQLTSWREDGLADELCLSVNLSPRQFLDEELVPMIATALEGCSSHPERLWLEVTESAIGEDVDRALHVLQQLSDLGVSIHIDDFGTGFSSLSHLTRFPVVGLKIDRSFVRGLPDQPQEAAVVRTILDLARSLDLHVVAEGIETPEQYAWLQRAGCSVGQGFLWSRPVPAAELETALIAQQQADQHAPFRQARPTIPGAGVLNPRLASPAGRAPGRG